MIYSTGAASADKTTGRRVWMVWSPSAYASRCWPHCHQGVDAGLDLQGNTQLPSCQFANLNED